MDLRALFKRQTEKNKETQSLRERQEQKKREAQGKVRSLWEALFYWYLYHTLNIKRLYRPR